MSTPTFAKTPEHPYYAVIFSSQRTEGDNGYAKMAERMVELAACQPGFLGVESSRDADGFGITVSYWVSIEAIANWKANFEHLAAQKLESEHGMSTTRSELLKLNMLMESDLPGGALLSTHRAVE